MKKMIYFIIAIVVVITTLDNVYAIPYYTGNYNAYYQRSQHTYSIIYKEDGREHNDLVASIYALYTNEDVALYEYGWDFESKYELPYTLLTSDYFLVYCLDFDAPFEEGVTYKKINLNNYDLLSDDAKNHVSGIVKNTYPYVSQEEMINNLVEKGVLVQIENSEGEKVYTAKTNLDAENSVTQDEIILATQLALHNFTNPGQVTKQYYRTANLHKATIVREDAYGPSRAGYDVVKNNVAAIYDYLITLEDSGYDMYIDKVEAEKAQDGSYYFRVVLSVPVSKNDELNISFIDKDTNKEISTNSISQFVKENDNSYLIHEENIKSLDNIKLALNGEVFVDKAVDVYVPEIGMDEDGIYYTQPLLGVSNLKRNANSEFNDNIEEVAGISKYFMDNPNTVDNLFEYMFMFMIGITLVLGNIFMQKKRV